MRSEELITKYGFQGPILVSFLRKAAFNGSLLTALRDKKVQAISGIYAVVTPQGFNYSPRTKAEYFNHFPEAQIEKRWVTDSDIIYLGKAGGPETKKANLQTRIYQLIRHGLGKGKNHKGGQDIWLLHEDNSFLLYWKEDSNSPSTEIKLLAEFINHYGKLPFGNKKAC